MGDVPLHAVYAFATSWSLLTLVAVAFTVQFAVTRYYDLTHALQILAGGYVAVAVHNTGVPLVVSFGSAALAGGIIGFATLKLVHTRLVARAATPLTHFLASAGLTMAGQNAISLFVGDSSRRIALEQGTAPPPSGIVVLCASLLSLATIGAVTRLLPAARAAAYVASDAEVAAGTGIDVVEVLSVTCALSGVLMGVAGACVAVDTAIMPVAATPLLLDGIAVSLLRWSQGTVTLLLTTALLVMAKQAVLFLAGAEWYDALTYIVVVVAVVAHGPTRAIRWS